MNKPECKVSADGTKRWYLNNKYHREDGPAIEYTNGDKCWYLNGKLHREDGPAIEGASGDKYWFLNDKSHREDGPATEFANGETRYWINGNYIPQLDNKRIYGKEKLQKVLLLI